MTGEWFSMDHFILEQPNVTESSSNNSPTQPSPFRTLQACTVCRKRKIKCDGIRPQCGSCISRNGLCTWPSSAAPGNYVFASQFSQSCRQRAFSADQEPSSKRVRVDPSTDISDPQHLPVALCSLAWEIFLERHHAIEFCSFLHTASLDVSTMSIRQPFLAHSIVALAGLYMMDRDVTKFGYKTKHELSECHAGIAREYSRESLDEISVATIQANLILTLHQLLSWKSLKAWVLAGVAIRHAQALRLGSEFNDRLSTRQKEIHRRTFWSCFLMDRLISYCCSRPQMIDLETVRISLPCPESNFAFEEFYDSPNLKTFNPATAEVSRTGILPFFITLLSLWGRAGYFMVAWGRVAAKEAPAHAHGSFTQLDKQINAFYDALPSSVKWSASNLKLHRSTSQGKLFVTFHLLLNHTRFVMHQDYLPQLDSPSLEESEAAVHNTVGAPPDFNRRTIFICTSSAENIADIISMLSSQEPPHSIELQSAFAANAIIAAAGVHMWIRHTEGLTGETSDIAMNRVQATAFLISSWKSNWCVAAAWSDTVKSLGKLYDTFYHQSCNPDSILAEASQMDIGHPCLNSDDGSVQTNGGPLHSVCEGNGVPHPDSVCQRLFDKIRFVILASLENPDVKKRMLNSYLHTLWQHMWRYEAVQGKYRAAQLENICLDEDWVREIALDGNFHIGPDFGLNEGNIYPTPDNRS